MKTTLTSKSWVTFPKPNPQASVRLFCLPYAGGSSNIFRTWPNTLLKTVEVSPIELPGRGTQMRLTPFTRLQPLVKALAQTLLPYLNKPFAFFGHSMGALVSFELTRILRRDYATSPVHLFVSGRCSPQIPDSRQPIHALPELKFKEELRRLNGTPTAILENAELMKLILPILRADFAVIETYSYIDEPPLDCPITVFGGLQDQEVSYQNLQAWQKQTKCAFSLNMLPGDHFFINNSQQLLLEILENFVKCYHL